MLRTVMWLALALRCAMASAQISGNGPSRIVDLVEVIDRDDHADIAVQFNCSVRYITHQPAAEGKELRIQLKPQADCGGSLTTQTIGELPPLSGGANVIKNVRVDADVPGQLTLAFSFKNQERFVLAQGADLHGLRLRLLSHASTHGKIMVNEPSGPISAYAVNLESQPADYNLEALQRARERLKVPVFVSQVVVDGTTWFRLRAGPFLKRADAERILNGALADYPRAWLAIGDDSVTAQGGGETLPAVEPMGADLALPAAELTALIAQARAAMNARDYPTAVQLLTELQRQPEFTQRAQMQELLGLARERLGQLAHAKAEYEEYLRRYPAGEAADRVARRLATLRAASAAARVGTGGGAETPRAWSIDGGFGQTYRYDNTHVDNTVAAGAPGSGTAPSGQAQSSNALYNDLDVLARRRGERFDLLARTSLSYAKNFSGTSPTSGSDASTRVSIASMEIDDLARNVVARFGRQVRKF